MPVLRKDQQLLIISFCFIISLFMHLPFKNPLTNASEDENPEVCHSLRFSFIERLLSDTRASLLPPNLALQPLASRNSYRSQPPDSAKNILKKTILQDADYRPVDRNRDNFLMKGRMLNGIKKPLESQMASLLEGINERINKEMERTQRKDKLEKGEKLEIVDLPMLQHPENQDKQKTDDAERGPIRNPPKLKCRDIFAKMKETRNARRTIDEGFIPKLKKNSDLTPNPISKVIVATITHDLPSATTQSERRQVDYSPRKVLVLKKGYIHYDEENHRFLEQYRQNMSKNIDIILQRNKQLTAKAFLIVDATTLTPIAGRNTSSSIQIASVSKVMTCYLTLLICKKYNLDMYSYQTRVSDRAAEIPGTTAELQSGDLLTINELMLGLMLPSGNDASVALAQAMGRVIQRHKQKETKKTFYDTFIAHMNLLSKEMGLSQTWGNSSGLSFSPNLSTPESIALLTSVALKNSIFNKIVNTKKHEIQIKNERYGLSRKLTWKNTNKLLQNGWEGVKTGTTDTAGHCLMAKKGSLLIGVYNCETLAKRFSECVHLYERYSHLDHF